MGRNMSLWNAMFPGDDLCVLSVQTRATCWVESEQCVHQEQDSDVHDEEEIGEVVTQIR